MTMWKSYRQSLAAGQNSWLQHLPQHLEEVPATGHCDQANGRLVLHLPAEQHLDSEEFEQVGGEVDRKIIRKTVNE